MVDFIYRRLSRLPTVFKCIIRSWDSKFHCAIWKEQSRLACMGQNPDTQHPPMEYVQGLEMRDMWVLVGSSAM